MQKIPEVVDIYYVADLFRVTPRTIENWMKAGKIKKLDLGRTVRFSRYELERVLQKEAN